MLYSTHLMLAALIEVKELEIDEKEAKRLADAVARVKRYYPEFIFSEKQMAWANLILAGGGVYGPRVMAFMARKKAEHNKPPVTIDGAGTIH